MALIGPATNWSSGGELVGGFHDAETLQEAPHCQGIRHAVTGGHVAHVLDTEIATEPVTGFVEAVLALPDLVRTFERLVTARSPLEAKAALSDGRDLLDALYERQVLERPE